MIQTSMFIRELFSNLRCPFLSQMPVSPLQLTNTFLCSLRASFKRPQNVCGCASGPINGCTASILIPSSVAYPLAASSRCRRRSCIDRVCRVWQQVWQREGQRVWQRTKRGVNASKRNRKESRQSVVTHFGAYRSRSTPERTMQNGAHVHHKSLTPPMASPWPQSGRGVAAAAQRRS